MEKKGTLRQKRRPKGDPNPQKGPQGDPGPLKGTQLGTVDTRHMEMYNMDVWMLGGNNLIWGRGLMRQGMMK